jgi:hypothetical protein
MTKRTPTARESLVAACNALQVLTTYVVDNKDKLDLVEMQLRASHVLTHIEKAKHEIDFATCDADAALARI